MVVDCAPQMDSEQSRETSLSARRAPAAASRLWRGLSFLPAALGLAVALAPPLNHDVAALLAFTERWLAGEALYTGLIDVNPPLIFLLNAVPAAIARWTPLDGVQALQLCLVLFGLLCWRLAARLRAVRAEGPVEAALLSALVPLALVIAGYDVGQREWIMGAVAIPYAALAARRIEGPPPGAALAVGVALLAAMGFALKPHFLGVPALVELLVLLRVGPRRALRDPVPWTIAAFLLAYGVSIPVFFPDFLGFVVPLVWGHYLDLSVFGFWGVLLSNALGAALLLLAVALPAALPRRAGALAQAFALAAVGAFLAAWVQHKGWTYHAAPVLMLAPLALAAAAGRRLDAMLPPARSQRMAPPAAALAALALFAYAARGGEAPWAQIWRPVIGEDARLAEWLRREAYGQRILVLSPDIFPVYPALNYARATSTLRTMTMWLLQGSYPTCPEGGARFRETWEMGRTEFFVYRTTAEDFAARPPSVVLVSRRTAIPDCGGQPFDYLDYFGRHPLFAATFARYRESGQLGVYRLFVREE
jgi:hypothetical protein